MWSGQFLWRNALRTSDQCVPVKRLLPSRAGRPRWLRSPLTAPKFNQPIPTTYLKLNQVFSPISLAYHCGFFYCQVSTILITPQLNLPVRQHAMTLKTATWLWAPKLEWISPIPNPFFPETWVFHHVSPCHGSSFHSRKTRPLSPPQKFHRTPATRHSSGPVV